MKSTKFKCKVCNKLLSSKQSGLHHVRSIHSIIIDLKDHIIPVQVAEKSTSDKENSKFNQKAKNSAYGFFKNLSNLYASEKYVEDFRFGSSKQRNPMKEINSDNSLLDPNANVVGSSNITLPLSGKDRLLDEDENQQGLRISDLQYKRSFDISHDEEANSGVALPSNEDNFSDSNNDMDKTTDFFEVTEQTSSLATVMKNSNSTSIELSSPLPSKRTRGNCGNVECEGCSKSACGFCINCVHKRVMRQRCIYRKCSFSNKKVRAKSTNQLNDDHASMTTRKVNEFSYEDSPQNTEVEMTRSKSPDINSGSQSLQPIEEEIVSINNTSPDEDEVNNILSASILMPVNSTLLPGSLSLQPVVEEIVSSNTSPEEVEVNNILNASVLLPVNSTFVPGKPYKCKKCGVSFSKFHYAKNHCKKEASKWICDNCGIEMKIESSKRHIERCKNKRKTVNTIEKLKFRCTVCDKQFDKSFNCKRHEQIVHGISASVGIYKCHLCSFSSNLIKQVKKHITVQHSNKECEFKCNRCQFSCFSPNGLRQHNQNVHGFECKQCGKMFSTEAMLSSHVRMHGSD